MKIKQQERVMRIDFDASGQVVSRFIDAIRTNPDDAWAFVSKVYSAKLDLNELQDILAAGVQFVNGATYASTHKHYITRSVYVSHQTNTGRKERKLLHLRMVNEPDKNGKWKIYGVEQEEWRA